MVHSSKPRARRLSRLLSRSKTMLVGRERILVGPMCTFDPQQNEDEVQMTPAQRSTRIRSLRRSRRGLKKKPLSDDPSRTKIQEQNRLNGLAKTVCVKNQKQHRLSRNTVNENELPNKFSTHPSRSHYLECAIHASVTEPTLP